MEPCLNQKLYIWRNSQMSVQMVSASNENPRMKALKARHAELSVQIEEAQKSPSITNFYVKQLKKQKLLVKEKIESIVSD